MQTPINLHIKTLL